MMMLALFWAAQASVVPPPSSFPQSLPDPPPSIVVTGERLSTLRDELAACIARKCPPPEEIQRSLALAEIQFIAGDYLRSRATLLKARRRNARHAAQFPTDVADLHRATALLSNVNGLPDPARIGTIDAVDALKKGLPENDSRIFMERLRVGEVFAREGRLIGALDHYAWVAKGAKNAGLPDIEGQAMLRSAVLLAAVGDMIKSFEPAARRAADAILARPEPAFLPYRNGVRVLRAQLAPKREREAAVRTAMQQIEPDPNAKGPLLIYAPPIDMQDAVFGTVANDTPLWADVAFNIAPDGRVTDVETLRSAEQVDERWVEIATRGLRDRRYAPSSIPAGGLARVERYSFVADFVSFGRSRDSLRSRIPVRSSQRRVEVIDISLPQQQASAKTPAGS
ncbi:hypothetical protein [uncultured Sphingomonas sp.]|uniref:hypothetical protein n=1 Tax=uncultured Sphingomonas sp. TaxID=158754 RepID=UPI00260874D6|nr:hypothetical protein [uncultured Sphingomonas sp.]